MSATDAVDAAPETTALEVGGSTGLEFSPELANVAKALIRAQGSMDEMFKDSTNPHFRSKYAALPACINATKPALLANGIALIQGATSSADASVVFVTTMFLHESGEWIRCRLGLRPVKEDPQGAGSAITYGKRYTLLGMCGVAPDDDDDGNAASRRPRADRKPNPSAPAQPPATPPSAAQDARNAVVGKLTRYYALLGLTGPQIAERLKRFSGGRVTDPDRSVDLNKDEMMALGAALKAEHEERARTQVCDVCTTPPGEPHFRDANGTPCPNDDSEEAIRFHADAGSRERNPELYQPELI